VSLLDWIVAIIIAASVITGFVAGFARVGIGFIAAVSGVLFGFWFYGIPADWFLRHVTTSVTAANLLGFFSVFFGCVILGSLFGTLISKLFKWAKLSWLDRLLGAMFGVVRGSLIAVAFIAVLMAFTPKPAPNWMVDSLVLPYAIDASDLCADLAPHAIKVAFEESMRDIRKAWEDQLKKHKKPLDLKKEDS
jgi:membrane protein required for colicin V production